MTQVTIDANSYFTADSAVSPGVGPFTQGDIVRRNVVREWIPLMADRISVMNQAGIPTRTVSNLDMTFYTGNPDGTFTHGINDAAHVEYSTMGTNNYSVTLKKGQGAIMFLDAAMPRGETWETMQRQISTVVQGLADARDKDILSVTFAGAGSTQAAAAVWDSGTPNILDDILSLRDTIAQSGRGSMGFAPMSLVTAVQTRKQFEQLQWIANANQNLNNILRTQYDVDVFYTNDSPTIATEKDALMFCRVPSNPVAELLTYRGPGLVPIESGRIRGVGEEWLITDFFKTVVHEFQDGASSGDNELIGTITTILT